LVSENDIPRGNTTLHFTSLFNVSEATFSFGQHYSSLIWPNQSLSSHVHACYYSLACTSLDKIISSFKRTSDSETINCALSQIWTTTLPK